MRRRRGRGHREEETDGSQVARSPVAR